VTTTLVRGNRARAELIDVLRAREPETSTALFSVLRPGPRRHTKVWVTRHEGAIVGLLVSSRYCFDRWSATLFLDDLDFASEMAAVLDRSSVWSVGGPVAGLEAVLPHVRRSRGWVRLWFYAIPPQPPEPASAGLEGNTAVVVRPASASDLEALVDLYAFDEHNGAVSRRRLRGVVRERLQYTVVAEAQGKTVGALAAFPTDTYRVFDALVVHPDARGSRIGMALLLRAGVDAMVAGHGVCGVRAMSNGLRVSHEDALAIGDATVWAATDLRAPKRFKGQSRLRRLLERLEGGVLVPPRPEPSPYSVLPPQAESSSQSRGAE
jgi:hypothetical protein